MELAKELSFIQENQQAKKLEEEIILKEAKEHLAKLEKDKEIQEAIKAQEQENIKEHNKLVHQELIKEKTEYFKNKEKELAIELGIDEIKGDFVDEVIYITAIIFEKLPFPVTKILGRALLIAKTMNDVITIEDDKIGLLVKATKLEQEKKEFCESIKEVNNELHTTCEFCFTE
jgi:hypothetical protein